MNVRQSAWEGGVLVCDLGLEKSGSCERLETFFMTMPLRRIKRIFFYAVIHGCAPLLHTVALPYHIAKPLLCVRRHAVRGQCALKDPGPDAWPATFHGYTHGVGGKNKSMLEYDCERVRSGTPDLLVDRTRAMERPSPVASQEGSKPRNGHDRTMK